ncbi:hypothetical protein QTO34_009855 [Cnephaeus nilssonii]|uniref:Uncharacterized protein n=1 Tax=Cnephaeus nilssonii TaxID=3371016 RepID=A0AA40HEG0_CNENI|nr:hypothetical protein QTO34_009855 [Eptesicus nilssonii]
MEGVSTLPLPDSGTSDGGLAPPCSPHFLVPQRRAGCGQGRFGRLSVFGAFAQGVAQCILGFDVGNPVPPGPVVTGTPIPQALSRVLMQRLSRTLDSELPGAGPGSLHTGLCGVERWVFRLLLLFLLLGPEGSNPLISLVFLGTGPHPDALQAPQPRATSSASQRHLSLRRCPGFRSSVPGARAKDQALSLIPQVSAHRSINS